MSIQLFTYDELTVLRSSFQHIDACTPSPPLRERLFFPLPQGVAHILRLRVQTKSFKDLFRSDIHPYGNIFLKIIKKQKKEKEGRGRHCHPFIDEGQ